MKKRRTSQYFLDKEEREILQAVESGAWKSAKPSKAELARYAAIARNTLRKH